MFNVWHRVNFLKKVLIVSLLWATFVVQADDSKPRVIALSPHIVELLFEVGAGAQIIGTTDYADFPEQAKTIPRVGSAVSLQIEKIVELQPDIIIAWQNGNPAADLAKLKSLGYEVQYSYPIKLEDVGKELRWLGAITKNETQAHEQADKFDSRLSAIRQKFGRAEKMVGFYELWSSPLTTISKGSWPHNHLDICGVTNPFENAQSHYPQVNIEQVLSSQVQVIIQPLSANQSDKTGFDWQQWPSISAVENNRILRPNADKLHRMSSRLLDELERLCVSIQKLNVN